LCRFSAS